MTPGTRAVALTWVHSSTGVKLPVRAIADALAERDAELGKRKTLLCVDAVHGFGVEPEPLPELGCDFLVSGLPQVALRPPRHRDRLGSRRRLGGGAARRFPPSRTARASRPGFAGA